MRVRCIIQARMDSHRLPGKVLVPIRGVPILARVVDSINKCENLDSPIVATTSRSLDRPIYDFCLANGISVFRGSKDDVLGRLVATALSWKLDALVRICADSPLINGELITFGVDTFLKSRVDLVTNVFPRTFPKGQSVEVIKTQALSKISGLEDCGIEHKEHVTRYFYDNHRQFKILNFSKNSDSDWANFAVDTIHDLRRIEENFDVYRSQVEKLPHQKFSLTFWGRE